MAQITALNFAILFLLLSSAIYVNKIAATQTKLTFDGKGTIAFWKQIGEIVEHFHMNGWQQGAHGGGRPLESEVPLERKFPLDELLARVSALTVADGEGMSRGGHSTAHGGKPAAEEEPPVFSSGGGFRAVDTVLASIKRGLGQIESLQKGSDHQGPHQNEPSKKWHDLFLLRALFEMYSQFLGEVDKREKQFCANLSTRNCNNFKEVNNSLKRKNAENINAIQESILAAAISNDDSTSISSSSGLMRGPHHHHQPKLLSADFKQFETEQVVGKFHVELPPLGSSSQTFGTMMEMKEVHNQLKYPIWLSEVNNQGQTYGQKHTVEPGKKLKLGKELTLHLRIEHYEQAFEFYDNEDWNLKIKNCNTVFPKCQQIIWKDVKGARNFGNYAIFVREEGTKLMLELDYFNHWSSDDFSFEMSALTGPQLPPHHH